MTRNQKNSQTPETDKQTEAEKLIDIIVTQTRDLLENSWADLQTHRRRDVKIKVTVAHTIEYTGGQRTVKSDIGFGSKYKDSEESSFDVNQLELSTTE